MPNLRNETPDIKSVRVRNIERAVNLLNKGLSVDKTAVSTACSILTPCLKDLGDTHIEVTSLGDAYALNCLGLLNAALSFVEHGMFYRISCMYGHDRRITEFFVHTMTAPGDLIDDVSVC